MKADRLLSALFLLQAHGRLPEREIAERLEVSQRTAHRDMEALCAAGVPLIAHRGVRGGWELEKGWRTRVPGLDETELRALLMAQPSGLGDRRLTAAAERAFNKLLASLSPPMRAQAESMRVRLHVDATGWRPTTEDLSALSVVQDALERDVKLTFQYAGVKGTTTSRTVDPLGLVSKQTAWYMVARAPEGMRTFRVSRMRDAVALAIRFERPPRFNLAVYWKRSTEALQTGRQKYKAILGLSSEGVTALAQWVAMKPLEGKKLDSLQGWQAFVVEFDSFYSARFVALGLGGSAVVLGPEDLRRDVGEQASAVARATQELS
ncbi:MAG TPA: WYL domain-containing protein [Acidobacteriaceae bacterium]|nr:WYL domain-containing protein [Acidobacteriaceae bacterium]